MVKQQHFRLKALKKRIANSRDSLYRVALAWCGDEMLADDLTQEAITEGVDKCRQLRDETRLSAWLFTILRNKWYRHLKSDRVYDELNEDTLSEDVSPLNECIESEMVGRVRDIVMTLPLKERQVLSLVDLEELSYCEVAEILQIPVGTVMSRLHRARKNLVAKFEKISIDKAMVKDYLHVVE